MSRHSAVEATLRSLSRALSRALISEDIARRPGLLQALDPRVRLLGIFGLVVATAASRRLSVIAILFAIATGMALASYVPLKILALRVWLVVFAFTGVIALPAVFTTPGTAALRLAGLTATTQGIATAELLVLRVGTAVTLTSALVLATPWNQILKALRSLGVPAEVIAMLAMTHRYIFLFLETTRQMFEARQSRMLGDLSPEDQRGIVARTAAVLMGKSIAMSQDVFLAMQSRGFRGEIRLLRESRFRLRDVAGLIGLLAVASAAIWAGI